MNAQNIQNIKVDEIGVFTVKTVQARLSSDLAENLSNNSKDSWLKQNLSEELGIKVVSTCFNNEGDLIELIVSDGGNTKTYINGGKKEKLELLSEINFGNDVYSIKEIVKTENNKPSRIIFKPKFDYGYGLSNSDLRSLVGNNIKIAGEYYTVKYYIFVDSKGSDVLPADDRSKITGFALLL